MQRSFPRHPATPRRLSRRPATCRNSTRTARPRKREAPSRSHGLFQYNPTVSRGLPITIRGERNGLSEYCSASRYYNSSTPLACSRQDHRLHSFHPGLVEGRAQAELVRHRKGPRFGYQRAGLATLERHSRLDQVLQHRAERLALRCHAGRSRRDLVPVRNDLRARILLGQLANLQPFADPAALLRIRLHEADEPPIQKRLEVPARVPVLAGGQRDPRLALQMRIMCPNPTPRVASSRGRARRWYARARDCPEPRRLPTCPLPT